MDRNDGQSGLSGLANVFSTCIEWYFAYHHHQLHFVSLKESGYFQTDFHFLIHHDRFQAFSFYQRESTIFHLALRKELVMLHKKCKPVSRFGGLSLRLSCRSEPSLGPNSPSIPKN